MDAASCYTIGITVSPRGYEDPEIFKIRQVNEEGPTFKTEFLALQKISRLVEKEVAPG